MNKLATGLGVFFILLILRCPDLEAQEKWNSSGNKSQALEHPAYFAFFPKLSAELATESFEEQTFPPNGWKTVTNFGGTGWQRSEVGSEVPGIEGDEPQLVDLPPQGGNAVALCSWQTGDEDGNFETGQPTDQWLITPRIPNIQPDDSLTFYLKYFNGFGDTLDILISTNSDAISDFTVLLDVLDFVGSTNNDWIRYSYSLTDFVEEGSDVYIAFREHVDNTNRVGDALLLDLVTIPSIVTAVADQPQTPLRFELLQNYPNPFNPSTNIVFSIPQSAEVTLKVYNLLGRVVTTLIDGEVYAQGQHSVVFEAANLSNGIYYYKIEAMDFASVKKMILFK